jgi:hypothetical protein
MEPSKKLKIAGCTCIPNIDVSQFVMFGINIFQGDREQELGLPFSPLCDRKNTLVAESQIGNINLQ